MVLRIARFGFAFKGQASIRTITVQLGKPDYAHARIYDCSSFDTAARTLLDELEPYHAGKSNIEKEGPFSFKLLWRAEMFELYIDDVYVQSYLTPDDTSEIYLYIESAILHIERIMLHEMRLA